MKKYLIKNDIAIKDSFFMREFKLSSYLQLILGNKSYNKIFTEKLSFFTDFQELIIRESRDDLIGSIQRALRHKFNFIDLNQSKDVVFYYSTRYFPIDIEKLNNIFAKTVYANSPVKFFVTKKEAKRYLPIFYTTIKDLNCLAENDNNSLEIDLTDVVFDLEDPDFTIKLMMSNFQLREFNHLKQGSSEYLEKSSNDKTKMQAEYNYLSNLPNRLKPFYPVVGDFIEAKHKSGYEIEKIYALDASKILVNNLFFDPGILNRFLGKIEDYLKAIPVKKVTPKEYVSIFIKKTIDKNNKRLMEIKKLAVYEDLNHICRNLGFKDFISLNEKMNAKLFELINSNQEDKVYLVHGDLCFSNILYNINTNKLKLIDPRGYSGSSDEAYGSIYYDLAKLSQSFLGLYDLLVYDKFDLKYNEDGKVSLKYYIDEAYQALLEDSFVSFVKRIKADLKTIRIIEASLFMSMIPLHKESKKRMLGQVTQSINLLKYVA